MIDSKECGWRWATASGVLVSGPCELIYARTISATAEDDTDLYDGTDPSGVMIIEFEGGVLDGHEFSPRVPVYCQNGLYVTVTGPTVGVFVMWRERPTQPMPPLS